MVMCVPARADVELPRSEVAEPITITAATAVRWEQGYYEVWLLGGGLRIEQGRTRATGREAVLWIDRTANGPDGGEKVIAYLEGDVEVATAARGTSPFGQEDAARATAGQWLGRFFTVASVRLTVPSPQPEPALKPALYHRAVGARNPRRDGLVQPAQFVDEPASSIVSTAPITGGRSIRLRSRTNSRMQVQGFPSADGSEWIAVLTSGVNMVIEGAGALGTVDLSTDRLVLWTPGEGAPDLSGATVQPRDVPLEIYMEGNIVFRQGDRVIYARSMYYNVSGEYGVVLDAEVLTPVPQYEGILRLKADVLRQLNARQFEAQNASITSSRLGVPSYWAQSENIAVTDYQTPGVDPLTGSESVEHQFLADSRNNFVYLHGLPVFYWPRLSTDLRKPTFYVDQVRIKNDSVFGTQLLTDWDMYQLLGVRNPIEGTDWTSSLDLMSERGVGGGTIFRYERDRLGSWETPNYGEVDAWGILDGGLDNLGEDRRAVPLEEEYRGRVRWHHRQFLGNGYELSAELGVISDRNFLEEYYEYEWDRFKDQTTDLMLSRSIENRSWSVFGQARPNDFFTETEWLPRFDHFTIGQSLLWDRLTWTEHTNVSYAHLKTASTPTNPVDAAKFAPLAWEADREGVRAATRHELAMPLDAGPVKVVPYLLGEVAHWGEDLAGENVTRAYGQAGVRASVPFWTADPTVCNTLLNLNGLAHKVVLDADLFWADANQDMDRLPLYDELNDNSIEHMLRRSPFNTFGGAAAIPLRYDERYYALRSGMQNSVTAPSTEIADDLAVGRVGLRQRWQTKRGLPGRQRIVDWITFDVQASLFPNANRDNFGQELGLVDYDVRWHLGDRVTLLSDGAFDFFGDGLRTASLGAFISRPEIGSAHVGFRTIEGPFSANVLSGTLQYRMSPKWIASMGSVIDLSDTGNIGQSLDVTRIGEAFLVTVGMYADAGRDSVGARLLVQPRFLSLGRRGMIGGVPIPPPGTYGLE